MTAHHIAVPALSFNGVEIHARNEMLSLTDMWKACGSPADRRPDDWKKDGGHREFLDHVAMVLNAPVEGIWKGTRGRHGGGTSAHWQIGLAYAKWLDHDLHMWCNTVVRERMEGKLPAALGTVLDVAPAARGVIGGIVRDVLHKQLAEIIPAMVEGALLEGGHVVSTDYKPALDVLKEKKVPAKRRRSFSQKCSARLRRFALSSKRPPRLSRETGRYLFHVDTIRDWLEQEGNALISSHVSSLTGQAVLPFKKK